MATLKIAFLDSTIKIIICNGITQYPTKEHRNQLIEEAHSSAVGGHKGVTKTYNRIRQRYYWENMKLDIQKYIQLCLQCQFEKLVRVKTKDPMIITDTPGTAFEKCTPYELVFGKLARLPSSDPLPEHEKMETYDMYITKLITKLHEMRGIARQNLIEAKQKSKEYYNRKINPQNFKIGDSVFLLEGGELRKFENQYSGPYEVLEILGKGNIKISIKNKPIIVNINRLRLSYITPPTTNQSKKN